MKEFDSLGARQLPPEEDDETFKEIWGGREVPLNAMVVKDVQTEDLIAREDLWEYMASQIEPDDLVEFIKTSASRSEIFSHFDFFEVALYEEVI